MTGPRVQRREVEERREARSTEHRPVTLPAFPFGIEQDVQDPREIPLHRNLQAPGIEFTPPIASIPLSTRMHATPS